MPPTRSFAAALTVGLALTACSAGPSAAPRPTVTVTATAPTSTVTAAPASPGRRPKKTNPAPAVRKRLPDVVGMNLQAAQDTLQAAGFWMLDDQDATGQGRLQVFDRNWVVTRQTPAAGRSVPTDSRVVLYAKKYGE